MVVKAWVTTHTGLPSVYSDSDVDVRTSDGRILHLSGQGAPVLVSDALASPGIETTYLVGGQQHALTRPAHSDPRVGLVTTTAGRSIPGALLVNNLDPTQWSSDVAYYPTGVARWPMIEPATTGESVLLLLDPALEKQMTDNLRSRSELIIGPASPTQGVPLRRVVVDSVRRSRLRLGRLQFDVSWTEAKKPLARNGWSGAAPVVTWGEAEAYRRSAGSVGDLSFVRLAELIAGMP